VADNSDFLLQPEGGVMARKTVANLRAKEAPAAQTWVAMGFDVSMACIAGAAFMYDSLLDRLRGPVLVNRRWPSSYHYFDRCREAAKGHDFVHDLIGQIKGAIPDIDQVYIAVEEPWPMGIIKRAQSGWVKQQAQIQGIFLGSLLRWGYTNVYEVNNQIWKEVVRGDLGRSLRKGEDKWDVKEWAIQAYGVPDMPDLIQRKDGLVSRPEGSKAKAKQPEDVYDAIGICDYMRSLIEQDLA
jgi:hypothetical protein